MGFFQRVFGGKKTKKKKKKKKNSTDHSSNRKLWSFLRSLNFKKRLTLPSNSFNAGSCPGDLEHDPSKHAIAVAVATAAVAEAALAAAQAAAEVVRLTGGRGGGATGAAVPAQASRAHQLVLVDEAAAVKIQCAFRGYLARRALRALKALVKLQALVRGHMVRKRMADMLRRMQTLVRVQARAHANRNCISLSTHSTGSSSSSFHQLRCSSYSSRRDAIGLDQAKFGSSSPDKWTKETVQNHPQDPRVEYGNDDEKGAKILEVDTWKPHFRAQHNSEYMRTSRHDFSSSYFSSDRLMPNSPSEHAIFSREIMCMKEHGRKGEELRYFEDIPHANPVLSRPGISISRRGPFSPTKSEVSWAGYSGYVGHPSYMSNTESSRAKVRSRSAPRQRVEFDSYSSERRNVLMGSRDGGLNSESWYSPRVKFQSRGYSERQRRTTDLR